MTGRRWTLWLGGSLAAVLFALLAVVFSSRFGSDPSLGASPLVGRPAPAVEFTPLEGAAISSVSDLRGSVVVLNFWAPWCVPCRAEHAVLQAAARDYAASGVVVVGLAYDSQTEDVIRFLDELGRGYPVAMDDRSRATIAFGVRGVPETFFIDRDGLVAAKVSGAVDNQLVRSTLDAILLEGEPPQP